MSELVPRLWSDFDGTAVGIARKVDPRNWSKYPLPATKGYTDFLRGVQATGVEIAGVVSRRPAMLARQMATARSITKLGFSEFFTQPNQIVHTGSEEAKGQFVAEQSCISAIGMLEDKPHKLGGALLGAVSKFTQPSRHPILLGVVSHEHSQEYIERLAATTNALLRNDVQVKETGPAAAHGLLIETNGFSMNVVQLPPFSHTAGQDFGQQLLDTIALR